MGLKDVYEDLKFKAIAKKEAINEWYASEKVQKRISKVKAKLQLAKEQAKKYAAEIEKNEQFKKLKERAAPRPGKTATSRKSAFSWQPNSGKKANLESTI